MAAANKQYNSRKKSMVVGRRTDTAADTQSLVAAANVMRTSNYHADPLAAMMQTRSIGLNAMGVTQEQKNQNKELLNRSLKVGNEKLHGMQMDPTTDAVSTISSQVVSPRVYRDMSDVEAALYRKKISNSYHTAVPKFMRSQGPFAVYDHAQHKGAHSYETVGSVNEQALARYKEQSKNIRQVRENEKNQFYSAMEYMDRMEYLKAQDRQH